MDQVSEKPKILLCRAPLEGADAELWAKLAKILHSIAQVEELEVVDFAPETFLEENVEQYQHIFLHQPLISPETIGEKHWSKVILVQTHGQQWESYAEKELWDPIFTKYPRLILADIPTTDLLRVLHLFLVPKKNSGVAPLMEKGSTILGEKIQGTEGIGALMDKLSAHLDTLDGFKLKTRVPDLRQILSSLLFEAFRAVNKSEKPYPTIDFQLCASPVKVAVNMRFPASDLDAQDLFAYFQNAKNLQWALLGAASDLICITKHEQHKEIEIHALITKAKPRAQLSVGSVLIKNLEQSAKKENLLVAPQNYQFLLLSEVKTKNQYLTGASETNINDLSKELNLEELPPAVTKKIEDLELLCATLRESLVKKEFSIKDNLSKLTQLNKDLVQKRNELLKLAKANETQQEGFKKTIIELEKKLEQSMASAAANHAKNDVSAAATQQEAFNKLETSFRAAENEKNQAVEKLLQEQKRLAAMEQKYTQLFKESTGKDKEIQDFKTVLLKLRKDSTSAAAKNTANNDIAGIDAISAKLKETESRESVFKQELKKVSFKLENHEKNLKAVQAEAAEKNKLLEHKLQAAKAKELDLLKKIDELSAALKKAAKAA